jgi:hypothetical protein
MTSALTTASSVRTPSRCRTRALIVILAATCCAHVAAPLWSQTNVFPSSGNVGIGTASPAHKLQIESGSLWIRDNANDGAIFITPSSFANAVSIDARNFSWLTAKSLLLNPSGGNVGIGTTNPLNPLQVHSGVDLNLGFRQYQGVMGLGTFNDAGTTSTPMNFVSSSYAFLSGNVGIGTTNPTSKLSVNGTIQAKEVVVNTGWADYVFGPAYRLRPLSEVATYIQQNHHLPEIPSEAEVKEKGIGVGEIQAKLLAKVEELTLHLIRESERNDRLESELRELRLKVSEGTVR